jgi:hypothetical protein
MRAPVASTGSASWRCSIVSTLGAVAIEIALLVGAAPDAAGQSLEWARRAGGPGGFDSGSSVAVDVAGNSYLTGFFTGSATFGAGGPNETTLTGLRDVFVAKYDTTGALLWVRQARGGDSGHAQGQGIAVDAAGNSYVTGVFRFALGFDEATTLFEIVPGVINLFVAKYDASGRFLWAKAAGLDFIPGEVTSGAAGRGISVDAAGNSHVIGDVAVSGVVRLFVAKYDSDGVLLWVKQGSNDGVTPINSSGAGISVDGAGNSLVVGRAQAPPNLVVNGSFEDPQLAPGVFRVFATVPGWTQFSGFTGIEMQHRVAGSPFDGNQFVELDSFASTGIMQEVPTEPGRSYNLRFAFSPRPFTPEEDNILRVTWGGVPVTTVSANGINLADTDWAVYTFTVEGGAGNTTALTFEDLGGSSSFGTYIDAISVAAPSGPTQTGLYLAKFDGGGGLIWARHVPIDSQGEAISVDAAGHPHITGTFFGTPVFGAGEPSETMLTSTGIGDVFIAKYSNDGTFVWAKQSSGPRLKESRSIAVDSTGSYVTGRFDVSLMLGAGESNETTLTNFASGGAFVAKYDVAGALLWARQTSGPSLTTGQGIAVDITGSSYVTGVYGHVGGDAGDPISVVFGPGEANETILTTSTGSGLEIFIAKFANAAAQANRPPVALDQEVITPEDTPIDIVLTATDADGDPLTYAIVASPSHGVISGAPPQVTYTPDANYNGPDAFTFRAFDSGRSSDIATVTIAVTPVNDLPSADGQALTTPEETPVVVTLTGQDIDGDTLSLRIVTGPLHGVLSGTAPNVTYTPHQDYLGLDSFTFVASDRIADSLPATVVITVGPIGLACGALSSGSIVAAGEVDLYSFTGHRGQIVSLALATTGGFAANPNVSSSVGLTLFAPSGSTVGTLRSNSLANFTLAADGTYLIRVRATNLVTTGSYNLNLECLFPVPSPDAVSLTCGTLGSGKIDAAAQVDLFTFAGSGGQIISLALASTGGFSTNPNVSSSVTLTLFAPSGVAVGTLRSNSQANFTLPEAGSYVIRVSATNLATTGSYNLNLECLFPVPSGDTVPLTCGTLASGVIGAVGQVDLYSFTGHAGQIVSLALASTGGFSTNPNVSSSVMLTVFAPSGAAVGTLRSNSQGNFTLPEAGVYVIRVSAANLATTGSYNLNCECLFPTAADAVPLTCGTLASGTVGAAGHVDLYTFEPKPGQIVSLALASTGGFSTNPNVSSSVALTLFAPSGLAVGTLHSNSQANFTSAEPGRHVLRVSATNLAATGSYNLNLECLAPPSPDAVLLTHGTLASGKIGTAGQVDLYRFDGHRGETVSLAIASTGGFSSNPNVSSSVALTLFSPSGLAVGTLRSNSEANFSLADAGTYVIRVSANNLTTVGSYNLNLEGILPASPDAVSLTCGTPGSGSIGAPGEVDLYTFQQQAGQMVSVTLASTGGFSTNPNVSSSVTITVFAPSGIAIGTLRSNSQAGFTLSESGTYAVRASASNLTTTGSYSLRLGCL